MNLKDYAAAVGTMRGYRKHLAEHVAELNNLTVSSGLDSMRRSNVEGFLNKWQSWASSYKGIEKTPLGLPDDSFSHSVETLIMENAGDVGLALQVFANVIKTWRDKPLMAGDTPEDRAETMRQSLLYVVSGVNSAQNGLTSRYNSILQAHRAKV